MIKNIITEKQINDLNIEDLKQFVQDGKHAVQYAWDHYEELAAREAVHTLYGPYDYYIGAAIPGKSVSKKSRTLTFKTSRKKYLIYELDSEYKLLRVRHVFDHLTDATYHFFELDGIQHACPFISNQKKLDRDEILALSYKAGKPYFLGRMTSKIMSADFYEYISPEKMLVTEYYYNPVSIYSLHGYPLDLNAPIGALNSPADRSCWEEKPMYTDFSKFFTVSETSEPVEEVSAMPLISDWIDKVLDTDIPDDVVAFCFNLYEEGGETWSMELIGSSRFDSEDPDWPCDEITDFGSRKNLYEWEMDCSWEDVLTHVVNELKEYLENGKYAKLLKSRSGVGVGFVDGDLEILTK